MALATFVLKIQEVNNSHLKEGFVTLKNLRGGLLSSVGNNTGCTSNVSCPRVNPRDCVNSDGCENTTNMQNCTNMSCI